ncbi:hypothetical protein APC83_11245 [Acinetobacter baumannii]|uniref:hypothetical protein n=1 Tax=Acinetobacter baumannii TaxID=470 RepID=UPI00070B7812|nr:hypothetical protein [Acinetobacter baumannii]KRJ33604.1 hypothetical protein APC83_11245 [Acinetobacter baumannii]
MDKCREEFEKKLKCQDLLSELTFCEKTSSYEGDILPTNLATINGAYWAWVKRQAEMDEQQAKVEELQRRNQMLNDNIKEQGQKLVYQNEVIETQAEKLLGLRDEKAELQKQIDALEKSYFVLARIKSIASKNLLESILIKEVRQALKGEGQ